MDIAGRARRIIRLRDGRIEEDTGAADTTDGQSPDSAALGGGDGS